MAKAFGFVEGLITCTYLHSIYASISFMSGRLYLQTVTRDLLYDFEGFVEGLTTCKYLHSIYSIHIVYVRSSVFTDGDPASVS